MQHQDPFHCILGKALASNSHESDCSRQHHDPFHLERHTTASNSPESDCKTCTANLICLWFNKSKNRCQTSDPKHNNTTKRYYNNCVISCLTLNIKLKGQRYNIYIFFLFLQPAGMEETLESWNLFSGSWISPSYRRWVISISELNVNLTLNIIIHLPIQSDSSEAVILTPSLGATCRLVYHPHASLPSLINLVLKIYHKFKYISILFIIHAPMCEFKLITLITLFATTSYSKVYFIESSNKFNIQNLQLNLNHKCIYAERISTQIMKRIEKQILNISDIDIWIWSGKLTCWCPSGIR